MVVCGVICRCEVGVGSEKASYACTYLNVLSIGNIDKDHRVAIFVVADELTTLSIACTPVGTEIKIAVTCDINDNGRTVRNIIIYS